MGESFAKLVRDIEQIRNVRCFPPGTHRSASEITDRILALLFPHFAPDRTANVGEELELVSRELEAFVASLPEPHTRPAEDAIDRFLGGLPSIHQSLTLDARAIYHGDPAASSVDEVILAYPGFYALAVHRVAHELHLLRYPLLPRLASEYAHRLTGIDIHPGATLGRSLAIDHGTGIVIGESAIVGNGVKLFQGVTLGAVQVDKRLANRKRHPTLEDNVVVYANATILGGETVIGHDTVVGGNAWITESVPPFSIVGRHSDVRPRKTGIDADLEFYI